MDPLTAVGLAVLLLIILLLLEVPVGYSLTLAGVGGFVMLDRWEQVSSQLGSIPYQSVAVFALAVIPFFIAMGMLALHGNLADDMFGLATRVFRRLPGGLGISAMAASAGFGAVTGSTVASAATMGRLCLDRMIDRGYSPRLAAGAIAAAGTIGAMIPPSVIVVFLAIAGGLSTGSALLGGVGPGIVSAIAYMLYIAYRCQRDQVDVHAATVRREELVLAGAAGRTSVAGSASDARSVTELGAQAETDPGSRTHEKLRWDGVIGATAMVLTVVGGLYTGVFTATEAGAVGAFIAALFLVIRWRRNPKDILRKLWSSTCESAAYTSSIFVIIIGASVFSVMLVVSGVPARVAAAIMPLDVPPTVLVIIVLAIAIPLGMFLESMSILAIVVPITMPVMIELGVDPIWFGILLVKVVEIGLITPPVGITAFVVAGISDRVNSETVFRGVLPFILVDLAVVALLILVPDLITWLPSTMRE